MIRKSVFQSKNIWNYWPVTPCSAFGYCPVPEYRGRYPDQKCQEWTSHRNAAL